MEIQTHNLYLFKALDAYPYELEETIEALNYALSYDPNDVEALRLMGLVYSEQLRDYEQAKLCFQRALAEKIEYAKVYPDYIYALTRNGDHEEAFKLIEYAKKVKGIDRALIFLMEGQLLERCKDYKAAVKALEEAKLSGLNSSFVGFVKNEISRVKDKMPGKKKKKKPKKKSKKKGERKSGSNKT